MGTMRPRIKLPRNAATQPTMSRRRKRNLTYAFVFATIFGLYYIWSKPIDPFGIPFDQHLAWMNDRANNGGFISKGSYDWRKAPFQNKITKYAPLPTGAPKPLPPIQFKFPPEPASSKAKREKRRMAVRNEFERSWKSYRTYAWAKDELTPIDGAALNSFGGWGATLVDSLDSLWILGFKKDFYEAVGAVAAIDFGKTEEVAISVFETTIRYLGGFLSAYDLSQEKVLLDKAVQLGEMLYRAFDTGPNNMPLDRLVVELAKDSAKAPNSAEGNICFAAFASLTMEFTRLAQITQEDKYYDAVARVTAFLERARNTTKLPGLFPISVDAHDEDVSHGSQFTMGALEDSSYEYFPKMHALLGGLEPAYEKLWKDAAPMIDKHMLFRPLLPDTEKSEELLFCGDATSGEKGTSTLEPEMQHLTCFVGGMFGLAGRLFSDAHHVELGAKLTEGCIYAYKTMPTGIMPEIFTIAACEDRKKCPWNATAYEEDVRHRSYMKTHADFEAYVAEEKLPLGITGVRDKRYLLRPEAIESVFIMYRITGYEEYMDHAWDMFTSIVAATRTAYGNGQLFNVMENPPSDPENKMESFWLAETLKYFYLIFSPPDMISLDEWVFNTEAHPFRRPSLIKTKG
ncbi:seven-hairpin glycosidase [Byssothecium circinans]|uniref:alpha-1,2-Mannosidase n=1 Tax=Byssothecium circinans TaxID=147558 RepID=A0A6A5TA41_9PLEO|nr:seven-hairpin glycosidase [Byssothecium circinans]KAF1948609.1 seven-hairpin glycosidase [Byssothecium circinans]